MVIDRRRALFGGAILLGAGVLRPAWSAGTAGEAPVYASACRLADGRYALALLDAAGNVSRRIPVAARAHGIAYGPASRLAVLFARQPGEFALAFTPDGHREPVLFAPPESRCFFGHGVFSPDGRLLYATENDIDDGRGLLGIYDAGDGFKRLGELETGGVGPHEVILLSDGRTLAVANGGYETLPVTGRTPIDLASMKPSLVFIGRETGTIVARHEPPPGQRLLSIRHLAEDAHGHVWFGAQWEGGPDDTPDVIGWARPDQALRTFAAPAATGAGLKGYIGSVAASRDGRTIAASAPRAGRVLVIDAEAMSLSRVLELPDACGLAPDEAQGITISTGFGRLVDSRRGADTAPLAEHPGLAFDNHMRRLSG